MFDREVCGFACREACADRSAAVVCHAGDLLCCPILSKLSERPVVAKFLPVARAGPLPMLLMRIVGSNPRRVLRVSLAMFLQNLVYQRC
jgi:hypothetical protein